MIIHKELDKADFFQAINREEYVDLAIENVSEVKESKYRDNEFYIYIDYSIKSTLIYMEDDLKESTCGIAYSLKPSRKEGYHITENSNIYPIVEYALIHNNRIDESNRIRKSFSLTEEELKELLEGLTFKGVIEHKNNTTVLKPLKN